jgi:hypothetical protein
MLVNGKMTNLMDLEYTITMMVSNMKGIGLVMKKSANLIFYFVRMVMELKAGQMDLTSKENIQEV